MKTFQNLISPVVALALAMGAIILTPASSLAAKATASPFAGDWCFSDGWWAGGTMTISSRGSVSGWYGEDLGANLAISGSISSTGDVELVYRESGMRKGRGGQSVTVTGHAYVLDADTLVLELQFDYGVNTQVWQRYSP